MKFCNHPGCSTLVQSGYCDKHVKVKRIYDNRRESSAKRGYDARWKVARRKFLDCNPLCIECQNNGMLTEATVVDHIIPHKGDYRLFWDINNWQPLCKRHHDSKTAREDGGFGNS